MKFRLVDFDDNHYACNLMQSDRILKWDSHGNTHVLVFRGEFGKIIRFTEKEKAALENLSDGVIISGNEVKLYEKTFFSFVPAGEYVNNFDIKVSPASYAVFCCEYDPSENVCTVYLPNDACIYRCDVSMQIDIRIMKIEEKKHFCLFSKKAEETKYVVQIPLIPGYTDASLSYTFDGCKYKYPITEKMLGHPFTLRAYNDRPPKIDTTTGNGFKITVFQK